MALSPEIFLENPIENLPKTSLFTLRRLKKMGIKKFIDLLNFYPSRYEDYSLISEISKIQPGEVVTVRGVIEKTELIKTKKGLSVQKIYIADKTGRATLVWYNQVFILKILKKGDEIQVSGEVGQFGKEITIEVKEYEILTKESKEAIHTGRIVPIYPEKKGLTSRTIREKVAYILGQKDNFGTNEFLPNEILEENHLINYSQAIHNIHFPRNKEELLQAKKRLAFDELFIIQFVGKLVREKWEKKTITNPLYLDSNKKIKINSFISKLPFKLTSGQKKAWEEILADLQKPKPMNRLLQGDVGSGKTVVAALAIYFTSLNGYQSIFMAPTEILAKQHYQNLSNLFDGQIKIGLQTSGCKILKSGVISDYDLVIGTHALLNEKINFSRVGLVIIDEQHRFGVRQRALVLEKGINPHLLTMTATPIPRTVALTLYGELDFSIIDEMPPGRLPVKTFFVPKTKRLAAYDWIKKQIINNQGQVFIVCPLIEDSSQETMKSIRSALSEYEKVTKIFHEFNIGLIHGKMKAKEKEKAMEDFFQGKTQILVATPVVEVGVDIPNATIIIIEGAERFGLAQLHQLRGRVGRGDKQSYCLLFTEKENGLVIKRLKFFSNNLSGLKLAEYDLKHRGPGEIYGIKQHGLIELKIANILDYELVSKTKKAVEFFFNNFDLELYPDLKRKIEAYCIGEIARN